MKKFLIVIGIMMTLFIALSVKNSEVHEETTIEAKHVEEFGNSWYVDEIRLDKSFKNGIWNPKKSDMIDLKIDGEGRVIAWKVKR